MIASKYNSKSDLKTKTNRQWVPELLRTLNTCMACSKTSGLNILNARQPVTQQTN